MAGNRGGGLKTSQKVYELYGPNFYRRIGAMGGKASNNGGFASSMIGPDGLTGRQRARVAGITGGTISRRGKAKRSVRV